ncbi:MAG: hypothetical protein KKC72_18220 [Alphaproteobacteria bacterium]|nr:hypothetical protein [Alphaproteobacteria bacterium]MBU1834719.1 hypothetical protein [Alphaproteobacteria bacterium]
MSSKYGFGGGLSLPPAASKPERKPVDRGSLSNAVHAGEELGFVSREPAARRKPGPKRKEPQDKVSIPGPKRVVDRYRAFCTAHDLTLWQGLEQLLDQVDERKS